MTETDSIPPGQVFASVWDALEDSPAEAANMRLRSELMIAIQETVAGWVLTQAEAARPARRDAAAAKRSTAWTHRQVQPRRLDPAC